MLRLTAREKPQRGILKADFRMELRGQRSTLHTNQCCPLTNRCRRILPANTVAPVVRIWLLRGQLLLLLCSALQRPTVSYGGGGDLFVIRAPLEHPPGDNL